MAVSKSYISVPLQIINSISQPSLDSLLQPPKKKIASSSKLFKSSRFFVFLIFLLGFIWMLLNFDPSTPFSQLLCSVSQESQALIENRASSSELEKSEFWKQPDGMGYRPCLDFSDRYGRESKDRAKYLMVVEA